MEIDDPQVARGSKGTRDLFGGIWAERGRSELGAGSGFAQLLVGLYSVGASPVVMPTPKRVPMPAHRGAEDPIRAPLHGIGLGSSRVLSVAACQFDVTAS